MMYAAATSSLLYTLPGSAAATFLTSSFTALATLGVATVGTSFGLGSGAVALTAGVASGLLGADCFGLSGVGVLFPCGTLYVPAITFFFSALSLAPVALYASILPLTSAPV
jgi:hypothetical protein